MINYVQQLEYRNGFAVCLYERERTTQKYEASGSGLRVTSFHRTVSCAMKALVVSSQQLETKDSIHHHANSNPSENCTQEIYYAPSAYPYLCLHPGNTRPQPCYCCQHALPLIAFQTSKRSSTPPSTWRPHPFEIGSACIELAMSYTRRAPFLLPGDRGSNATDAKPTL